MIVSFIPGRIRLRFRELKENAAAESARERIAQTPGITLVEVNPISGSILIEYDQTLLPTETLIKTGKQELAKLNINLELP